LSLRAKGTNHPDTKDLSAIPMPPGTELKFNNYCWLPIRGRVKKCQKINKGQIIDNFAGIFCSRRRMGRKEGLEIAHCAFRNGN
jgi:hypothetical protein